MAIAPNTLSPEEAAEGFRLLFDGKSLTHWRTYGRQEIDPKWRLVEDAMMFHPDPSVRGGCDIVSVEQYSSFDLRLEWKLWANGNSGIMYHVQEIAGEPPFKSGPEIQLLDDEGHGGTVGKEPRTTGACYDLYAPSAHVARPLGEWNEVRLLVEGDHVRHWLNGTPICDYTLGSADWNARVAASKFRDWPMFASKRRGYICLQDHLSPVAFRNLRIKEC